MKNRISKAAVLVMALAGVVQATLVTDDFNRSNTVAATSSTVPNPIGTQYQIVSGTWGISSSYLNVTGAGTMLDTTFALTNDFTLSLKALHPNYTIAQGGRQAGIVLNYQDANNYLVIRWGNQTDGYLGNIQVAKYVDGVGSSISLVTNLTMAGSVYYDWTISSVGDTISYTVKTTNAVPTTIYSGSFTDSTFSDGYAGFYRFGGGTVRFDDYSLDVIPEPATLGLFGVALVGLLAARRIRKG